MDSPKIIPVQQCRSLDGWLPIVVTSGSNPDKSYIVHVNPWGSPSENVCECKGFQYRGRCRHQGEALAQVCAWNELLGPEVQTEDQRKAMICPRCAGATAWTMEVQDA